MEVKFDRKRITALRELKGLSVAEFAREIGVSRQLVHEWERGTYRPSIPMLEKIANKFKAPVTSFFTEKC